MLGIKRLDRVRNTHVNEMTNTQLLINTVQDYQMEEDVDLLTFVQ